MIVGLMAIWTGMGTFSFGDYQVTTDGQAHHARHLQPGAARRRTSINCTVPDGMVEGRPRDGEIGEDRRYSHKIRQRERRVSVARCRR